MSRKIDHIRNKLISKGLRVTPQRLAVLEAIVKLKNHPKAENIIDVIKQVHPNIATGTIYKILDTFVENDLIHKVKTGNDIMRYDATIKNHHHLYCVESDRIDDYYDDELTTILQNHFEKKQIENFKINDIKLQIVGNFLNNNLKH
ncbi:MAG: transcriptional repressor [Bacteroidales bacterium]|nr:transcriptional repressor [Bacteroidales bacterium]